MLFRKLYRFHERIKLDWRLLTLVSYLITAVLTTVLHLWHPGTAGTPLDGYLSTLAGILTSIVVTTFSFVFVALQLASVQFSPRVIRSFFEYDQFSRFFLWSFLACVAYLLMLPYAGYADAALIYPKFGIVGSFYLILWVFPVFIHHIIGNINASSITQSIALRTVQEIESLYGCSPANQEITDTIRIVSPRSGYLDSIRYKALAQLFPVDPEVRTIVRPHIGSFVIEDGVLAEIYCPIEKRPYYEAKLKAIRACFIVDKFRSYEQDIPFGIRQLVDIAIKAISPAVNDPTTALNCIDYLGAIIQKAALSDSISKEARLLAEKNIQLREFSFDQLVDLAFDQIYFWGKEDYIIVRHILKTVANLIPFIPTTEKLIVLIRQVEDLELQYLHVEPAVFQNRYIHETPFVRREHRNSLRDHLEEYYEAVIRGIGRLGSDNPQLMQKQTDYTRAIHDLRVSRE